MLNTVTSRADLPHSLADNQQTHYNSVRLLKGAVPGRQQVQHYTTELAILRNSKQFSARCQADHLDQVLTGNFSWCLSSTGLGGITADQKFYDPERVKDYTGSIRYAWNEETPFRIVLQVQRSPARGSCPHLTCCTLILSTVWKNIKNNFS